jgi:Protein of unknown function (DUF3575)
MKYLLCTILGFSVSFLGISQTDSLNNWVVKFNPTALINLSFPAIKIGIEKKIYKNLSVFGEFGYGYSSFRNQTADTTFIKPHGLSFSIEGRYYLKNKGWLSDQGYLAVRFFSMRQNYNAGLNYANIDDTTFLKIMKDDHTVYKKKWGVNFIYGKQTTLSERWVLDTYMGLGLRQKTITNAQREYDEKKHTIFGNDLVPYFRYLDLSESSGLNISFALGIRIGFILK